MPDTKSSPVLDRTSLADAHPSCAVLVMSCDAYQDLWTPFFTLFWRYWPDCPFPVYLGTNYSEFNHPDVRTLAAGHYAWSRCLRSNLDQIDAEYVLLLLEDYFFTQTISTRQITQAVCSLAQLSGTVLRLCPLPGPDRPLDGTKGIGKKGIGEIDPLASYRVSTQAAIWKKTALAELLQDDESIWKFEWEGSTRSRVHKDGFFCTYDTVMPYRQVVERGQWFRSAAKHFAKQQIGCDFSARPVMSRAIALKKAITRRSKTLLDGVLPARFRFRS